MIAEVVVVLEEEEMMGRKWRMGRKTSRMRRI